MLGLGSQVVQSWRGSGSQVFCGSGPGPPVCACEGFWTQVCFLVEVAGQSFLESFWAGGGVVFTSVLLGGERRGKAGGWEEQ